MQKEKVIFDTNRLYNKQATTFLAKNICGLSNFAKISSIVLPDMVVGELREKYKRSFNEEKVKFLKTILNSFLSHDAVEIDVNARLQLLEESEEVEYTQIELKNYSVLKDIKELALKKEPPFKSGVKEDPGFKDAYIYFTVLEYLEEIDDEYIFVCTQDETLKIAFEKHANIRVIEDFQGFREKSEVFFYNNDYFIEKFNEKLSTNISKDDVIESWIGLNLNKFLLVQIGSDEFIVEVDFQGNELVPQAVNSQGTELFKLPKKSLTEKITNLTHSRSFSNTHGAIADLSEFAKFLSDQNIIDILYAVTVNSQIISDDDVKQFISDIFEPIKENINGELKDKIEKFLNE